MVLIHYKLAIVTGRSITSHKYCRKKLYRGTIKGAVKYKKLEKNEEGDNLLCKTSLREPRPVSLKIEFDRI